MIVNAPKVGCCNAARIVNEEGEKQNIASSTNISIILRDGRASNTDQSLFQVTAGDIQRMNFWGPVNVSFATFQQNSRTGFEVGVDSKKDMTSITTTKK